MLSLYAAEARQSRPPLHREEPEDYSGEVALETPHHLGLAQALLAPPLDVALRFRVRRHVGDGDAPERRIGLAVTPQLSR